MFSILLHTACALLLCALLHGKAVAQEPSNTSTSTMELGMFSMSLTVSDIQASISFYQKLGFEITGGNVEQNWVILKNESVMIGLFQGMFEENILTFNPKDVRAIQKSLKQDNVALITEADETTEGPASIVLKDPDGNMILIDQF